MVYYQQTPDYYNDYIAHYGVKGMKWRRRKASTIGDLRNRGFSNGKTGNRGSKLESGINAGRKRASSTKESLNSGSFLQRLRKSLNSSRYDDMGNDPNKRYRKENKGKPSRYDDMGNPVYDKKKKK